MARNRNRTLAKLIEYCTNYGLEVHTSTKARGHKGVFLHNNTNLKRIDISRDLPKEQILPVIAHEFAHFFHHSLDKDFESLQEIFGIKEEILIPELEKITEYLTKDSGLEKVDDEIEKIKQEIKQNEFIIKQKYPDFLRSKKFNEFEKFIKNSPAKYLLKYDRVKVLDCFKLVIYSIEEIKTQFPDMPEEFIAYINLRALMRRQKRFSNKKRKINKYYSKSSELLARFVECWVLNQSILKELAPYTLEAFTERIEFRSFKMLKGFLELINDTNVEN